jgi:AraC-like DNA-binding protein
MTKVSSSREITPAKEIQKRGTAVFPLQYNFCNTDNPFYDLWIHSHEEFEIVFIHSGNYRMYINDREENLETGDVCVIPGGIVHGDGEEKGSAKYESAVFDVDLVRLHGFSPDNFINEILQGNVTLKYRIPSAQKDVAKVVSMLFDALREQREGWDSVAAGAILILFGLIKKNHLYEEKKLPPTEQRIREKKLDVVLGIIKKNYGNEISLEQLASASGLSPKYFCRIFKEIVGKSPVEYLNWFRINKACAMLRETDEKLSDISVACGFKDFSYFVKIFHRCKGTTPLKYRNTNFTRITDTNIDETSGFFSDSLDSPATGD